MNVRLIVKFLIIGLTMFIVAQGGNNKNDFTGSYWCVKFDVTDTSGVKSHIYSDSNSIYTDIKITKSTFKLKKAVSKLENNLVYRRNELLGSLSFSGDTLIFTKDFGDPNGSYKETLKLLKKE